MSTFKRKSLSILLVFGFLSLVLGYAVLHQVKKTIVDTFNDKVVFINQSQPFQISYDVLEIQFLSKSFRLVDIAVVPDSLNIDKEVAQPHISIEKIEANNFNVLDLIFGRKLTIEDFKINGLEVVIKNERRLKIKNNSSNKSQKINKPLNEIRIGHFELNDYMFIKINDNLKDTIFTCSGNQIAIESILFDRTSSRSEDMTLTTKNLYLKSINHTLVLQKENDSIFLKNLVLDVNKGYAKMEEFTFGNAKKLKYESKTKSHNTPLNAVHIPKMEFFGIRTDSLLLKKVFVGDSITILKPALTVVKNIDKPWNKNLIVPLPQQSLRNQKNRFWINKVNIENGNLKYIENSKSDGIEVPIKELNASITNIGTISDVKPENSKATMKVDMDGTLFENLNFKIGINFRDPRNSNHFDFYGSTGPFHFESFNPIMVPTSGIMFESGNVSSISFEGYGNEKSTTGDFVMKFSDLEAIVLKKNANKKNKSFSWLANVAVRKQNPKNGKLKVAKMGYDRILYKGFGNYMFKTIESGLTNSVYPLGARKTDR